MSSGAMVRKKDKKLKRSEKSLEIYSNMFKHRDTEEYYEHSYLSEVGHVLPTFIAVCILFLH